MSSVEENKQVVRRMFDGFNAHDREAVANTLSDRFVYGPFDRDEFLETEFAYLQPFPDLSYSVDDLVAEGDQVASRWRFVGTHTGPGGPGWLQNMEPTGKRVEIPGIAFARVENGLITEWWGQWNTFGLLRELGAVRPTAE